MKGKEEPPGELTTRGLQKENRRNFNMHDVLNNDYFWLAIAIACIFAAAYFGGCLSRAAGRDCPSPDDQEDF